MFGTVIVASIVVLMGLGLLVMVFWIYVNRVNNNVEPDDEDVTNKTVQSAVYKSKWKPQATSLGIIKKKQQQNKIAAAAKEVKLEAKEVKIEKEKEEGEEDFTVRLGGNNKSITVGKIAVAVHTEGEIDDPLLYKHGDKYILTYTVGGRALYYTTKRAGQNEWSPPTVVVASDRGLVQNASAFPVIYRLDGQHLCTSLSNKPIATFEFHPLDESEPAVMRNASQSLVLLVYAVKNRGLCRMRSIDGGRNWSASHLVIPDTNACRPALFQDSQSSNVIHLVYMSFLDEAHKEREEANLFYTVSKDNGVTFYPISQEIGDTIYIQQQVPRIVVEEALENPKMLAVQVSNNPDHIITTDKFSIRL